MGEAKKRREQILHDAVAREFMNQGKIIEFGWQAYRKLVVPADAGPVQLEETRTAFFAGAQHLCGAILGGMDEDHEVTADDLIRMDRINAELAAFAEELKLRIKPAEGQG